MARSPLYPNANREVSRQINEAVRKAGIGRAVNQSARSSGGTPLMRALNAFARGVGVAAGHLAGSSVGQLAKQTGQLNRNGTTAQRRLVGQFMKELGPIGDLIMALSGGGGPSLSSAANLATLLLKSLGREVTPIEERRRRDRPQRAARAFLDEMGDEYVPDEELPPDADDRGGTRRPAPSRGGAGRNNTGGGAGGGGGGGDPNDPAFTGDMVPAPDSSNVYSYGYNSDTGNLFVRFRDEKTNGPGSLYRYSDVTIPEFRSLMSSASKGGWVWDNLRIRGTITGHQKDYALVGIVGGYVPRKATWAPLKRTSGGGWRIAGADEAADYQGAAYIPRNKLTTNRNWVTSIRPLSPAFGGLDSGKPPDGRPNRGTPNRGGPRRPNQG